MNHLEVMAAIVVLTFLSACETRQEAEHRAAEVQRLQDEQRPAESVPEFQFGQLADAAALPINWQGGTVETDEGVQAFNVSSNVYTLWNLDPMLSTDASCRLVTGGELTGLGLHMNEVLVKYSGHGIDEYHECPDNALLFIGADNFQKAVRGREERLAQENALHVKRAFVRQIVAEVILCKPRECSGRYR